MKMLLSLMPWILFWVLAAVKMVEPACFVGFFGTLIEIVTDKMRKKDVKILQVGTMVFFLLASVAAIFLELENFNAWVRFSSNLVLAGIALGSIMAGHPFTMAYAKEKAPRELWDSAQFIDANYAISRVWCITFFINMIPPILRINKIVNNSALGIIVTLVSFTLAVIYTRKYKKRK